MGSPDFPGCSGYIDAHSHLADPRISGNVVALLEEARQAGISGWLQGGLHPTDWKRQKELASEAWGRGIHPVFGVHPWWVAECQDSELEAALRALESELEREAGLEREDRSFVAIGEAGLDHAGRFSRETHGRQLHAFERQLELAARFELPLVLHVVQAHGPALELLEAYRGRLRGGLVHSFSRGPELAARYLELGFLVSVSGAVTRKGFESLKRAVVKIPDESLVLETDCPDQAIEGQALEGQALEGQDRKAGSINAPANLLRVAHAVSALRGPGKGSAAELLERSTANLRRVFGLKS